jgi:small-conductance mechanosensitive channel
LRFLIVVWAATRLAHLTAPLLKLNLELHVTAKIRAVGIIYATTWFLFKWKALYVDKLVSTYMLDAPRIYAFDKVISLLMALVAASLMGEITGFALRSLLAVGGFSGVALGLASKEIVSNFFGGAVLFATRPFVIGERIKTGNFSGYVQDIGFLQTKILSLERVPMVVPNQNFTNQVITNYSRAVNKLMEAEFPLRIQDVFHVDRITSKVVHFLRNHPDVDTNKSTPVCYLKNCTGSSSIIAITAVIRAAGGSEFYRVQQSILLHIAEIIISEGAMIGGNSPFGVNIPVLNPVEAKN